MHSYLRYALQTSLGFKNYLFFHGVVKAVSLRLVGGEKDFLDFLDRVPKDSTLLDIGAGIGTLTIPMAKKVGGGGKVFAFEPLPDHREALEKIISFFGIKNIRIFDFALGDKEGKVEMVRPIRRTVKLWGLSHVITDIENNEPEKGERFGVEMRTLDSIEELRGQERISAIKIDVENSEYAVLKGGEQLIRRHYPFIYIELWDNKNRRDCFDFARGLGYKIYEFNNHQLKECMTTESSNQDFMFIPPNHKL